MPKLEWEHDIDSCPLDDKCGGLNYADATVCEGFPSIYDRRRMAEKAYKAYAEADGTEFIDFFRDVVMLALEQGGPGAWSLGDVYTEVTKAYMLSKSIEVPAELPL